MISEPELVGGAPFETAEVLTEERPPRPPRARRPWLWALGGAVAASAVWGAGLYAYGQRAEPGPDLGGYKPLDRESRLCEAAELTALGGVLGKRGLDGVGPLLNEPSLSEVSCSATFGPGEFSQSVEITYTLHKVTDPGPEFAARALQNGMIQKVEGIGEEAFFQDNGEEGGTLHVLDGQTELRLSIYRSHPSDENGTPIEDAPMPDLSGIDVPMTQDALDLMAALKK
ncbi:hypothetical protein [Streptomyces sp. NPDC047974]|uniref:hypothetical protein n=1 Tax=Streptomyces sp. NPDC047974 TaxID=3154343 RepID=UPI0033E115F9